MSSRPLDFNDRLLAEATAAREQLETAAIDDRSAIDVARAVDGDFEQRLVVRAESLPFADSLRDALRHVRQTIGLAVFLGLVAAAVAGAATARAALGTPRDEPANFFHVLAAVLGVQTLLLIVWIGLMCAPRSAGPALSIASLGGIIVRGGHWLARRVHPGRDYAAAIAALSRAFMRGLLGRWTFSAISHGLWLSFNVGCLAMLIFLLSTRQYAFSWETTLLSERTYTPLTRAIAALPKLAGFVTPDDHQIAASQWKGAGRLNVDASQAWSGLLVGSIVVYGIGPRLLLLGLSLGQRRAAKRRHRLDVNRPDFARLRGVLEPVMASAAIVDGDDAAPAQRRAMPSAPQPHAAPRPFGLPAIVGFELPPSVSDGATAGNWPPRLHGVRWRDLGMADSREDRRRVIDELSRSAEEPSALVVVCSLTTTPDRGVASFLLDLAGCVSRSPVLALSGGQRLRERADHARLDIRIDDWRAIARSAGFAGNRVIEIDFDHLTHNSLANFAEIVIGGQTADALASGEHQRRLEQAFALIVDHVRQRGHGTSSGASSDHTSLHRAIAKLYGDHVIDWRAMFRLPSDLSSLKPANLAASLQSNAERFVSMLPARLQRSPKWLAAGATTGALGCITAAALISPAAISALPVWSLIGAAVGAVVQPAASTRDSSDSPAAASPRHHDETVRSAALFALLLELQGRDESTITRVLDRTIAEPDVSIVTADDAQRWLDDLRHRFDVALAQEVAA